MKDKELRGMLENAGLISCGYQNMLRVSARLETIRTLEQKIDLLMRHLGVTVDYDPRIKKIEE